MSKLDTIMSAFGINEENTDTSEQIDDTEVETKADDMAGEVEVITEQLDTEIIGGDE